MFELYLRLEPTTDYTTKECCRKEGRPFPGKHEDVVAYRDPACTTPAARWPWHYSSKPRRNCKRVMLDCFRWHAVWL